MVLHPELGGAANHEQAASEAAGFLINRGSRAPILTARPDYRDCRQVILDAPRPSVALVQELRQAPLLVGIDTGGAARLRVPFLIDSIPRPEAHPANVSDSALLHLPDGPLAARIPGRVVISFGGEDPARLSERVAHVLCSDSGGRRRGAQLQEEVIVVRPSLRSLGVLPPACRIVEPSQQFWELLSTAEICLCQFGLTAFEARALGCTVITVAPTPYHNALARHAGFTRWNAPRRRRLQVSFARRSFQTALGRASVAAGGAHQRQPAPPRSLHEVVERLCAPALRIPPIAEREDPVVYRTSTRTYRRCSTTGLLYLQRFTEPSIAYNREYFDQEYQAQYGRTYLEDFPHIKRMGARRATVIAGRVTGRILDIGCAYGPFLAAAAERGFTPYGIDVAPDAVRHVTEVLHITAVAGDVLTLDPPRVWGVERFDAVTLWYVIEHVRQLDRLLTLLRSWVRPNGVLAFSTPNAAGVSARRSPHRFFRESPSDHLTLWTPGSASRVLRAYGFQVFRTVVTGHHPERYPAVRSRVVPERVAALHSHVAGWGDTFEIYARRTEET